LNRQLLIAARIKQARESLNMSQEELGAMYGCSDAHISRIEKGDVKLGVADIERFAVILGKPLAWFISDQVIAQPRPPEAALPEIELSLRSFVPVYGEVSAGEGMEPIDFVAYTRLKPAAETIRAFRVKGLCLEPEIHEGDTLAGIQMAIKRLCARAGITGAKRGPHTFRHTAAINYLRNGGSEFTLQIMLGHSTLSMTRRYVSTLGEEDLIKAHQLASPVDNLFKK